VLLGRCDGKPFTINAWAALDDYMCALSERLCEGEDASRSLTPRAFGKWLHQYHMGVEPCYADLAFPSRSRCIVRGLRSEPALNGLEGVVVGHKANGRVKLQIVFDEEAKPPRDVALKVSNLRLHGARW
jgi:hypothetical protein